MLRFLKQFLKERVQFGSDFGDFQCMKKTKNRWRPRETSALDPGFVIYRGVWYLEREKQRNSHSYVPHPITSIKEVIGV